MNICVYGAASPRIDQKYFSAVERLGEIIAERGHSLVFGAGENGLMGAVAKGVTRGGGKMHGVIPTFFAENKVEAIYPLCTELTYTETMRERKRIMEDCADAFIIVPGGIGTFEEFFEILTLKQLGRHTKPIVIYNLEGYYTELLCAMETAVKKGFITESCLSLYVCVSTAEAAVNEAEKTAGVDFSVKDLKEG